MLPYVHMKNFATAAIVLLASGGIFAGASPAAPSLNKQDLPNFGQVGAGFYRGAAPTEAGLEKLKAMGVLTVIDLRIAPHTVAKERKEVKALGLRFVNLPMGSDPPTKSEVATFLQLADGAGQSPIYVHCQHGADRTGTMVGIYREVHDRWSFSQAYAEMRRYGFNSHWAKLRNSVEQRASK